MNIAEWAANEILSRGMDYYNVALEARERASRAAARDGALAAYLERLEREPLPNEVLELNSVPALHHGKSTLHCLQVTLPNYNIVIRRWILFVKFFHCYPP